MTATAKPPAGADWPGPGFMAPMTGPLAEPRFLVVEINAVHESKTNPRRHFDATALKELTDSVHEKGVLVPLLVRPRGTNGAFEIIAGARRYRAARAAGLVHVPVILRDLDDKETLEVQVIENLQRADVHPLEEAEGYEQLLKKHGYVVEDLAAKIGKSISYVYQRLKLAALSAPAKEAFLEDKITAGHAILIARLQPKDQADAVRQCSPQWGRGVSVRELVRWIDENIHLDLHAAPWKKDDAKLLPIAGPCTTCPKRTGFQPALFPDVAKKDTCTDPHCYQAKRAAHLAGVLAELRQEHGKVALISDQYQPNNAKAIGRGKYKDAKKGSCRAVEIAVFVEGDRTGQTTYICADQNCKTHRDRWERSNGLRSDKTQAAARATALRKQMIKSLGRRRAFEAISQKVPSKLGTWELQFVARMMAKEMHHDALKRLCDMKGWKASKGQYGGWRYEDAVAGEIRKLSGAALVRILFELAIAPDLEAPSWIQSGNRLREAGSRFHVNIAALERRAAAELKAKKPTSKKAKKAKR